jgi:death on curing protein
VTKKCSKALPSAKTTPYSRKHRGKYYPTVLYIISVHDQILEVTTGISGVLKPELLDSAAEKPVVTHGGQDSYPTLFTKVAAIGHAIAHGHVFQDANKRTAAEVMVICLSWNQHKKVPNKNVLEAAIILVAAGYLGIDGLRLALLYAYKQDLADTDL